MKFTKAEKIWLAVVVILFVLYNLPFVPHYDSPVGTLVHAALTLIPLWIAVYVGLFKVSRAYKHAQEDETAAAEGAEAAEVSSAEAAAAKAEMTGASAGAKIVGAETPCRQRGKAGDAAC